MKTTSFELNITDKQLGCRIVHLSDLHKKKFGKENFKLIKHIKKLAPDIIVITGDMISRSTTNLDELKNLITNLSRISPVYYSLGNHEKDLELINRSLYEELIGFLNQNCDLLDNRICTITFKDTVINICGLTIPQDCYKKNGSYRDLRQLEKQDIEKLIPDAEKQDINIMLAHNPIFFDAYAQHGLADIILSGHVHGGCVRLPFLGAVLSPERTFFPKYSSGMYSSENSKMIVSCGLGKFRLFNPSEIVLITLN